MSIATLSIDLETRLAAMQEGLDKAGRLAELQARKIEAAFTGVKTAAFAIGGALTAALSVPVVFGFVKSTIDGIDALNDLADATGASIENLSALEDIAARTGTSVQTAGDAVIKLNKVLSEARPDNDAGRALKAIGLSAEELRQQDPAEALRLVAVALSGYQDDANKARLVQELFGKSAKEVAPLLKDLAEAGQLNATVTTEQAAATDAFNKQIFQFQKNVTDSARALVSDLVPALNQLFDALQGRAVGGSSALSEIITVPLQTAAIVGANLAFVMRGIGTEIGGLAAQAAAVARLDFSGAATIGRAMKEDAASARAELDKLERQLLNIGQVIPQADYSNEGRIRKPGLPALLGGGEAGKPGKPEKIEPFVVRLDDATQQALKLIEDTDGNKIAALRLQLQALIEIRAESGAGSVDEAILAVEEALNRLSPAAQQAARDQQRLNELLGATPQGKLDKVLADIALLNAELERNPQNVEQWADAVRQATEGLGSSLEEPLAQISEFAQQASRNIQDALGDSVLASMEGSTRSIEDIWKNMLKRLVAQAAAAQLGKWLLGDGYGKTGQMGGAVGDFFSWLSSLGGGTRANGGPVYAGRPYLVGERGPEVVVPRANGTVLPNGVMPAAAGGGAATYQVIVQGDASANTVRLINAALAQYEARQMRRMGG